MNRQNYEHLIGQRFTLKSSITSRPDYFNDMGNMDKYLDGVVFTANDVIKAAFGWGVEIYDGHYDRWYIRVDDIVPIDLDNRKVRADG